MSTYILTSMFPNGFNEKNREVFQRLLIKRNKFAFVASEFEKKQEITDNYFHFFMKMFEDADIHFTNSYVVDGRMSAEEAQRAVAEADVVWLSGGDTPTEFSYFQKYGLCSVIKQHKGIVIGLSAGSINLAKTAICTLDSGHDKYQIYPGLGCVDISVEPHFIRNNVSNELLELSREYTIYGLCDDSMIVCSGEQVDFYGEIYKLCNGNIEEIK